MKPKKQIFIIEDEALIFLNLKATLEEMGCEVCATASRIDQAASIARTGKFDMAILDINLNGTLTYPVADILRSRSIPFIFTTGYGRDGIESPYAEVPFLPKPFSREDLYSVITELLSGIP